MKKNLVSILSAIFTIGITLVFITAKLADKEQLYYIGTATATVISALAMFFIVKRISADSHKKLEQNNELIGSFIKKNEDLEKSLTEYINMQDKMNELFSDFCSKTDSAMEQLEKTQKAVAAENTEHIAKLSAHIEEMINKLISEYATGNEKQRSENAEHISKINELTSSFISSLQKTVDDRLIAINTEFSNLIKLSADELSKQREKTAEFLSKLTQSTGISISEQITVSFDELKNIQKSCDDISQAGMKKLNDLVTDFKGMAEKKLEDMDSEYHNMLAALKAELGDDFDRLSACVNDSLKRSSDSICVHNNELSDKLTDITAKYSESLENHNNEAINFASEQLAERNRDIISEYTKLFCEKMELQNLQNDEIIKKYAQMLVGKTEDSINQFIVSSDEVFGKNASMTAALLETERIFIDKYDQHNESMKQIIEDCFIRYSEEVSILVTGLEKKISEYIGGEKEAYEQQLDKLKVALQEYSDSFVDRSANAVAKEMEILQQDNSVKLKKMCDSITELAETSSLFADECRENDRKTAESIDTVIQQNKDFIDNMRTVNSDSISYAKVVLDDHLISLKSELSEINAESSRSFSTSMEDYRERFVEASAQAVANIQKDNISAITSAHEKLSELSCMIQDSQMQYSKLTSAITTILSETRNAISDGNEIAKKHYEDQDECLENRISDLERIFKNKLKEYNDKLEETLKIIVDLEKVIKLNTESYHNTLKQITDSQNAMNSLTSKDIAVLERLVNK